MSRYGHCALARDDAAESLLVFGGGEKGADHAVEVVGLLIQDTEPEIVARHVGVAAQVAL